MCYYVVPYAPCIEAQATRTDPSPGQLTQNERFLTLQPTSLLPRDIFFLQDFSQSSSTWVRGLSGWFMLLPTYKLEPYTYGFRKSKVRNKFFY